MNKQSSVAVLMPVYNSEKYLKESIESILNQTYSNFEFYIINKKGIHKILDLRTFKNI